MTQLFDILSGSMARTSFTLVLLAIGAAVAGIGVVIGLMSAYGLTRLMTALLYGVSPTDPLTYGVVAVVLICIALLASYLPARRAASVNPIEALRAE